MLIEGLLAQYGYNEPIFIEEIKLPNVKYNNLKQILKRNVDNKKINRFANGIYYFSQKGKILGKTFLDINKVIERKYLCKDNKMFGFYSGYMLANMAHLTTQVPAEKEITSNIETSRGRSIALQNIRIKVKAPRTAINNDNINILMVLDLISNAKKYSEYDSQITTKLIKKYIKNINVTKKDLGKYIQYYPAKVSKTIIEKEFYDVFA